MTYRNPIESPVKRVLEKQQLLRPPFPVPLEPLKIFRQLQDAGIAPNWKIVEKDYPRFVKENNHEVILYLHKYGVGCELLSRVVQYLYPRLLEGSPTQDPIEVFQSLITTDFIKRLKPDSHDNFMINVRDDLQQMVTEQQLDLDDEEFIEEWLIEQLQLDEDDHEYFRSSRKDWHRELEAEVEPLLDEPDDDDYNLDKVRDLYREEPSKALIYFRKLPVDVQVNYIERLALSHIESGADDIARELLAEVRSKFPIKLSKEKKCQYLDQLMLTYIAAADTSGLITCFNDYDRKGFRAACTCLGVSEEQFCTVLFMAYFENERNITGGSNFTEIPHLFAEVKKKQKSDFSSFARIYKKLLSIKIYLYGEEEVTFPEEEDWQKDPYIVSYLAIKFGSDNHRAKFIHWLSLANQIGHPYSTGQLVAQIYEELQKLIPKVPEKPDADIEDDDDSEDDDYDYQE